MRKTIILLSILLLLAAAVGCGPQEPEVLRLATTTSTRAADPLSSWNDGKAKQSIVEFVGKVTQEGSPN